MKRLSYWALLISIVLLPWYVVRFAVNDIPITLLEASVVLTIGLWMLEEAWRFKQSGIKSISLNWLGRMRWWIIALVGFGISATVALIIAPDLRAALGIYKAYIIEPLLLGIVVLRVVTTPRAWWGVMAAFSVVVLEIVGLSFSQWLWQWPNFAPAELSQGRTSAVYNTANAVGLFLGPLVLVLLTAGVGLWQYRRGISVGLLSVGILGVGAILLSLSEGAVVALGVGFGVILGLGLLRKFGLLTAVHSHRRVLIFISLIIYVVGIIGYVWLINQPPTVANPYTRPGFTTLTVRQCTWEGTKLALSESPVLGFGLAGFTKAYLNHATCDAEPFVYPHNFVLNFWAELGLVGLLAIIFLLGLWLYSGSQLLIDPQGLVAWIGIGIVAGPVYWLVHGLVDVPYFKNDLSVLWWILLALAWVAPTVWGLKKEAN